MVRKGPADWWDAVGEAMIPVEQRYMRVRRHLNTYWPRTVRAAEVLLAAALLAGLLYWSYLFLTFDPGP